MRYESVSDTTCVDGKAGFGLLGQEQADANVML